MNKKTLFPKLTLYCCAVFLSACNNAPQQIPLDDAPLAGAAIGSEFQLTDQNGQKRSSSEWTEKFQMVYFGYTNCPDICGPDTQNLMAGLKQFEKSDPKLAEKIQPLFISVDPKRDTPAVLAQFVSAFHPRLIGLTGSEEEMAAVLKSYAIYADRIEGSQADSYLMAHSQTPYLMGPGNKPLALLPVDNPDTDKNEGSAKAVAEELAKWVR